MASQMSLEGSDWQAVADSYRGMYGTWERDNAECVARGLFTNDRTKLIQTLFATLCACQVLFMGSRAPRVTWEAVYLPMVEAVLYTLSATGNGTLRMGDGNPFPFSRMASWLITCPIMLFMICGIHKKMKLRGLEVRNMVMVAALIRVVCGMTATVTVTPHLKWMFFSFGFCCLCAEYFIVGKIFAAGIAKFEAIKTTRNAIAAQRIKILRGIFFFSWTFFPIIWVLSPTGLCLINEDVSAIAYLVADAVCKNGNGLIQTNTLFGVLNGKWQPESIEEGSRPHEDHSAETFFNQALSSLRHSARPSACNSKVAEENAAAAQPEAANTLVPRQAPMSADAPLKTRTRSHELSFRDPPTVPDPWQGRDAAALSDMEEHPLADKERRERRGRSGRRGEVAREGLVEDDGATSGEYDSGLHEEWRRAVTERKRSSNPARPRSTMTSSPPRREHDGDSDSGSGSDNEYLSQADRDRMSCRRDVARRRQRSREPPYHSERSRSRGRGSSMDSHHGPRAASSASHSPELDDGSRRS